MTDISSLDLSRLQFGMTAMYHFLFVPLTLGLSFMLAIMESVYVMTGNVIWRDMTKFWGILFGINFAMGVCTGVPLEFQFGTNWAYYSQYVGDIFGSLLAIEGLMAFFLEATFIGLFFFGWNRLSKVAHLVVTWLVALGSNFSALWILVANGWMQNPVGSKFNPETMRMEMTSFYDILFNPVAQAKFVHTVSAGYVTGAMFVLSISAFYLLRGRHVAFAKRSMVVAASFGLASALSVVVLGDESGYSMSHGQKMKLAAMEAMWETHEAPASLTIFGIPDTEKQITHYEVSIPWALGIIATRTFNTKVPGIKDLVEEAKGKIVKGQKAYGALQRVRQNPQDKHARALLNENEIYLGYGLLLKRFTDDVENAGADIVQKAADYTVPNVPTLFWTFRIMVGLGLYMILLFAMAFYYSSRQIFQEKRWFLKMSIISLPFPWIAIQCGWLLAEHGRQPWTIDEILPTFLSGSEISSGQVWTTLIAFIVFYTVLLIVDVILMKKYIKLGPDKALSQ